MPTEHLDQAEIDAAYEMLTSRPIPEEPFRIDSIQRILSEHNLELRGFFGNPFDFDLDTYERYDADLNILVEDKHSVLIDVTVLETVLDRISVVVGAGLFCCIVEKNVLKTRPKEECSAEDVTRILECAEKTMAKIQEDMGWTPPGAGPR
jgi:hypothetical protein